MSGDRRLAAGQEGLDDFEQLTFVDRTAAQFEIDGHMHTDRRRSSGNRLQGFRMRVDSSCEFPHIGEVPQRLDAARGGADADRHEAPRKTADLAGSVRRRRKS
jgi:hypothetical protein